MSDQLALEAVRLAIVAAGQVDDPIKWQARITTLTPQIASMLRLPDEAHANDATTPVVTARKVLGASAFRAEYVGHELEETSKRLVVRLKSATANTKETESDGTEHLRTEPMWTPAGRAMRRILDALEPGQQVTAFKHVEPIDAQRKVRVLVHLEPVGRRQRSPAVPPPPGETRRPDRDPDPPSGSRSQDEPKRDRDAERADLLESRYEALTPSQRVAFGRLCKTDGITAFMMPSDEDFDRVLVHLATIEKGGQS